MQIKSELYLNFLTPNEAFSLEIVTLLKNCT